MRGGLTAVLAGLMLCRACWGGAWSLPQGSLQIFSGMTTSHASERFDDDGARTGPAAFHKTLVQNWMEYGLSNAVTLVLVPQYVFADVSGPKGGREHFQSASVEAGGRLLLSQRFGMLALQASVKSAGAFDMSTAASGEGGRQLEFRLLYGRPLRLWWHDGFFNIELARRWVSGARPDEMALDVTLGWRPSKNDLLLLQSFSLLSHGPAKPPYTRYQQVKLQASLVHSLTKRWSLQSGYFVTPAGRNTVVESGVVASIWYKL